jgi:predicted nucleic acid-binding protein
VYLDTSVVATALFPGLAHGNASATFLGDVAKLGGRASFSRILWLEYAQVLIKLPRGTELPDDMRRRFRLARWETNADVRRRWMEHGLDQLETLLRQFDEALAIPFRRSTWTASLDVMARTQLRSHDAVHVATAREVGVLDFVTVDDHFRRVPDLRVWLIRDAAP